MFLIIGLGNPGREYEKTRHNLGFLAVDRLREVLEAEDFNKNKKLDAEITSAQIEDEKIILAKPQAYMNLSGRALKKIADYHEVETKNIIVLCDDFNLERGVARVRFAGSTGGHNGLKSIIESIGSDFWRVRLGIGMPENLSAENYVLQKMAANEFEIADALIDKVASYLIKSIPDENLENKTLN